MERRNYLDAQTPLSTLGCPQRFRSGTISEQGQTLISALWTQKWRILAVAILAAVVGFGVSLLLPKTYTASGELLLQDPTNFSSFGQEAGLSPDPNRNVKDQTQLLESSRVARLAVVILDGNLGDLDWRDIQKKTTIDSSNSNDAITIVAEHSTADGSVALVNALVQAYEDTVTEDLNAKIDAAITALEESRDGLQAELDVITEEIKATTGTSAALPSALPGASGAAPDQETLLAALLGAATPALDRMGLDADLAHQQITLLGLISGLDTRVRSLAIDSTLYGSGVKNFLDPETPERPTQPRPARNGAIAAILGILAASGWVWWRYDTARNTSDSNRPEPS